MKIRIVHYEPEWYKAEYFDGERWRYLNETCGTSIERVEKKIKPALAAMKYSPETVKEFEV